MNLSLVLFNLYSFSHFHINLWLIFLFTPTQVEQELIYYVHDNSETLEDHFTIIANDTDLRKHSTTRTVYVQVIPINDEPPVIKANKVLRGRSLN